MYRTSPAPFNTGARPPVAVSTLASLQTGDVVLVHCTHDFGKLTQVGSGSPWDHIGMAVRLSPALAAGLAEVAADKPIPTKVDGSGADPAAQMEWSAPAPGQLWCLEANGTGCFLFPLEEMLVARGSKYKYLALRRLHLADSPAGRAALPVSAGEGCGDPPTFAAGEAAQRIKAIEELTLTVWARPYQKGFGELLGAIINGDPEEALKDKSDETLGSIFCSELVAEAYQAAGLLPERSLNSNELLPHHFDAGGAVDRVLGSQPHKLRLGPTLVFKSPGCALTASVEARRESLWPRTSDEPG